MAASLDSDSEYESDFENEEPAGGVASAKTTNTGSSLGAEEAVRGALQASVQILCKGNSSLECEQLVSGALHTSVSILCKPFVDCKYNTFLAQKQKKFLQSEPKRHEKSCGKKGAMLAAIGALDPSTVPHCDKLTIHRKTPLDLIKDEIPRPPGSVPPTALPSWHVIDMAKKMPMVPAPANLIFYSRGKLGEPLHRCHPFYTVDDQWNQERVVTTPYNALHDRHAKGFLFKATTKKVLRKQGLINSDKDVICNLRDFNDFRRYLSSHYYDEVGNVVKKRDVGWFLERKQWLRIFRYLSNTGGRQAFLNSRRARARALLREDQANRLRRFRERERKADFQLKHHRSEKEKLQMQRIMNGHARDQKVRERVNQLNYDRMMWRRAVLKTATMRDIAVDERKKARAGIEQKSTLQFKVAWLDVKFEASLNRMEREQKLEEALRIEHEAKAVKRQETVERMRELIPATIAKKKAEKERLWDLVRKFGMRWLNKIRVLLSTPKDELHSSVWIGKSKGILDDTLKYLKELSGYEKMDDVVINMLKMKAQIKKQIELVEAAEDDDEEGGDEEEQGAALEDEETPAAVTGAEPPSAPLSSDAEEE